MTDLNTSNLQETINNVLQEALDTKSKKTSILLWTNHNPKLPNSFILKDRAGKKYLGLTRTDKKGETYWCFKEISKKKEVNQSKNSPNSSPVRDNIQKFEQRQEQAKSYGKPESNEQSS